MAGGKSEFLKTWWWKSRLAAGRIKKIAHLVMFSLTPVWMINHLQVALQNINTVTSAEVVIEDCVVLILFPAGLHTLQFSQQPGLAVQLSRLEKFF